MAVFSIDISFQSSRSKNYTDVLSSARQFAGFDPDNQTLHITNVDELFNLWNDFTVIIFNATKWAGTMVRYCEKPLLPYKNEFYYYLQEWRQCYLGHQSSAHQSGHCAESWWGCRKLIRVSRYINEEFWNFPMWYRYGYFISESIWKVDKGAIVDALLAEASQRKVEHCPHFSIDRIRAMVDQLPNTISVDGDHWEIQYRLDYLDDGAVYVPVGINHTDNYDGYVRHVKLQAPVQQKPQINIENIDEFLDNLLKQRKRPK